MAISCCIADDLPPWAVVYQQMRRRLGEQAAEDATRKYTWRTVAERVDAAYSSLLKSGLERP
jgi:glycosyltransferase involved in cell wall biosynthesis